MTPAMQSPAHLLISPLKNPRDPSQSPGVLPDPSRLPVLMVTGCFSALLSRPCPHPTPFQTLLVLFWVIADLAGYLLCASNLCL